MIAAVRRVLQNSFFNLVASVAQRLGQTVIFIVIARLLSDSDVVVRKIRIRVSKIVTHQSTIMATSIAAIRTAAPIATARAADSVAWRQRTLRSLSRMTDGNAVS